MKTPTDIQKEAEQAIARLRQKSADLQHTLQKTREMLRRLSSKADEPTSEPSTAQE